MMPSAVLGKLDGLWSRRWVRRLVAAAALAGGWAAAAAFLPQGAPPGLVLAGAVLGSATALVALGLILVYRANRIVNFAYGSMGGAAGIIAVNLFLSWHWNYFVSLACAAVLGLGVGALVEVTVVRRFSRASRLVLTVATIGLAQVLGGIELLVPGVLFGSKSSILGGYATPLSSWSVSVGPVLLNGDYFLVVVCVPVAVAGLAWFLMRSDAGTAIRAAAENRDRARLLGIPVRRLNTLIWAIAGALATLTFCLKAPFLGVTPGAVAGPTLLLPALAAAVVARMESLPVAFAAAVVLGVVEQIVRWNTTTPSLVDVVFLVVILGALLLQRRPKGRSDTGDSSWQDAAVVRAVPRALARLPEVRVAYIALAVLGLAAVVLVPFVASTSVLNVMSVTVIWCIVAVSLVVLTGWSGHISLGQFAFAGVGAMVAGNLLWRWDVDLFVALAAAGAGGAVVALVLGLPALRIRGPFLAVVTLAFAVALDSYLLNPNNFPGWVPQQVVRPVLWGRFDLEDERVAFWFCAAVGLVAVLAAYGVRRARSGRLLLAARDNPRMAEAMAVPTRSVTLTAFVFSGVLAGVAGGLHVMILHGARVGTYQPGQSIEVFSQATIGGLGSVGGALLGVISLRGVESVVTTTWRLLIGGTGLLVVLLVLPGGLGSLVISLRDRCLRIVARRRGMVVAGLVAPRVASERVRAPAGPPQVARPDSDRPVPWRQAPANGQVAAGLTTEPVPVVEAERGAPLLDCHAVDASYGALQVLFGVDFQVRRGEIVALLGTNGAGKSTLLKGICGLVDTGRGAVRLAGKDLSRMAAERIAGAGVQLMPGGRGVFPSLSVADNLRLAAWTFRRDRKRVESETAGMLELFPPLRRRLGTAAGNLSGGEQQQLALAQALMTRPELLLVDELSLGLAPTVVAQLLEVVRGLNRRGVTIVVVEQSVNVALTLAQRAVFMEKGEVCFEGPTRDLLDRPDILRSVFLAGAGAVTGGGPRNGDRAGTTTPARDDVLPPGNNGTGDANADSNGPAQGDVIASVPLVELPMGSRAAPPHHAYSRPHRGGEIVLECRAVTKRFGGITAVDGVDLGVCEGSIVGLVGQNGAGKTTLLDCISGFERVNSGRILLRGHDITNWAPHERARARLGRSFQEARLFPSLSVRETIATAFERNAACRSIVADAFHQPASFESELATAAGVDGLVELLGLGEHADKLASEISTGTRRIVELACLLAADPVVLLLDEPSAGVAQRETEALGPLLMRIRDHTGCAMLVIEHDMPLLSGICDQMVALELGTPIAWGTPAEVLADDRVIASYLGTDATAIGRSGAVPTAVGLPVDVQTAVPVPVPAPAPAPVEMPPASR
ncbi:MAG: ATP-binding cassette domain-containing protein [Acidimicrobiia bacterium]